MTGAGRAAVALVVAATAAVVVSGCVDRGAALLVENQTDADYLVRATGTTYTSDTGEFPDQVVVVAPANSKRMVVMFGFAGGFHARQLEVLRQDCSPIYAKAFVESDGTYVVIDDDAAVSIRDEFPERGDPAQQTTDCRTMPAPSASPASIGSRR